MRHALAVLVLCCAVVGQAKAGTLQLLVESDLTVYLFNAGSQPLPFDGYHLQSSKSLLDPAGWRSISDSSMERQSDAVEVGLGMGALTFGETKPSAMSLAELNLGSFGVLQPGERFLLGKPLLGSFASIAARVGTAPGMADDPAYQFSFHQPGIVESQMGDIVAVPEPAGIALAVTGLALLVVARRRLMNRCS
jgi:hypothetical protein